MARRAGGCAMRPVDPDDDVVTRASGAGERVVDPITEVDRAVLRAPVEPHAGVGSHDGRHDPHHCEHGRGKEHPASTIHPVSLRPRGVGIDAARSGADFVSSRASPAAILDLRRNRPILGELEAVTSRTRGGRRPVALLATSVFALCAVPALDALADEPPPPCSSVMPGGDWSTYGQDAMG